MSEIEDAKQEAWRIEQSVLDKRDAEIYRLKILITELCDALDKSAVTGNSHYFKATALRRSLIDRAREATR